MDPARAVLGPLMVGGDGEMLMVLPVMVVAVVMLMSVLGPLSLLYHFAGPTRR